MVRDDILWNPEYIIKNKITSALYYPFFDFSGTMTITMSAFSTPTNSRVGPTYEIPRVQCSRKKRMSTKLTAYHSRVIPLGMWNNILRRFKMYHTIWNLYWMVLYFLKKKDLKDMTCSNCFLDSLCVNSMLYSEMQAKNNEV